MNFIQIKNVSVVFGPSPSKVIPLLAENIPLEEITKRTKNKVAVKKASLEIQKGEIFVIMGLSGSGKSSLLRCLNGLNQPLTGEVFLENTPLRHNSPKELRHIRTHRISMVFQRFALMPWLNVIDNVAFGLKLQKIPAQEKYKRAQEALALVGLTEEKQRYPHELSGGMQQRVGLARALATGSDILLMDEPFSALDPIIRQELQNELLRLQKELHKTIVFVSHDLNEAYRIATRMAIMQNGEIIQIGSPKEIIQNPINDYVQRFISNSHL